MEKEGTVKTHDKQVGKTKLLPLRPQLQEQSRNSAVKQVYSRRRVGSPHPS